MCAIAAVGLLAGLLLSAGAEAQAPDTAPPPADQTQDRSPKPAPETWVPPDPSLSDYDWLQLTSGEWLKGDFERMRDRKVSFDSDELDQLELDWEDVARLRLSRPHSFRFEGRRVYRGTGEMRDGIVRVRTPSEVVQFERRELVSIVQGEGRERDRWSSKVSVGVAVRQGNTDQADFSGSASISREAALTRWSADYTGVISTVESVKTTNNHRASTGLNLYVTRRFYLTVPFFEYFTDEFQNISSRFTPGAGVGYELTRRGWLEWDATLGAGYQRTDFTGAGSPAANDFAVILGTELNFDFRAFDWDNLYRIQLVATDIGKTNSHFESEFSFDIWGPLDFDISFIWDRIQDPEPDLSGLTPESDDLRLTVGLGLDF